MQVLEWRKNNLSPWQKICGRVAITHSPGTSPQEGRIWPGPAYAEARAWFVIKLLTVKKFREKWRI